MGLRKLLCAVLLGLTIASAFPLDLAVPASAAGGSFGGGTGTSTDPYVIEDAEDLQNMSADLDAYYVLGGDVDASGTAAWDSGAGFMPVGNQSAPFTGSLDGRGHAITGLGIDRPSDSSVGLLGYIGEGGSVKDVVLSGAVVRGVYYVGALAGYNRGTVSRCAASVDVSGDRMVGGLVGWNNDGGILEGCQVAGEVSASSDYAGGLAGFARGEVSGCEAHASVSSLGNYIGGLVGTLAIGSVTDCHATGDVSGRIHTGGLVGSISEGTVSGSSATGRVSGLMGVGGLSGSVFFSTVTTSLATGDVVGNGNDVGGLVGAHGASDPADESVVSDCYATGDVNDTDTIVGGLVGMNRATVVDSYSTGTVSRTGGSGGLVGINYGGSVEGAFWDNETSGRDESEGGTGLPTAEMMMTSTFADAGWDLAEVWFIVEGVTYPCLRWQDAGVPTADAGPDRTVDLDGEGRVEVVLDGSGSTDDFGHLAHEWAFDDGGETVLLHDVTAAYTFERPGVYEVTLTVTDPTGHEATDTMVVTVRDVTAPVADAGPDQSVDEGSAVTFDGSGSSDNVGVANYTWAFTVGDVETAFYGVAPSFTFDVPGVYQVALRVEDGAGNEDGDAMTVTVRDVTPPVADAGPDRSVPVGSDVTLDASASTDNVGIEACSWAIAYEGTVRTLEGTEVDFTFDVAGTYEVVLNVTDLAGNAAEDTVVITVVGTGTVSGVVLDKAGGPVEGATVEVVASDGRTYSTTTAANGSFTLDVPRGAFEWSVAKEGYDTLNGTSSVDAMGTATLDVPVLPREGEPEEGTSPLVYVVVAVVAVIVVMGVVLYMRNRKGP